MFLGRLLPDRFMGGTMRLQQDEVNAEMTGFAEQLGLDSVAAALGIIRIVNASMAKAIRAVSLERGHDPKEFCLFSFGGASGLHCCELAGELSIKKIIVPARAGILSAQGMVFAEPTLDYMQTLFLVGDELETKVLGDRMKTLVTQGLQEAKPIMRDGRKSDITIEKYLNLRYQGQSYEIRIPYEKNFIELFHQAHEHNFGYSLPDSPLELVSIQCSIKVNRTKRALPRIMTDRNKKVLPVSEHTVHFEHGPEKVQVFNRNDVTTGSILAGPALIVDNYTTILLPSSFKLEVDELQNIHMEKL
jgi:N-methylhydantoinase A